VKEGKILCKQGPGQVAAERIGPNLPVESFVVAGREDIDAKVSRAVIWSRYFDDRSFADIALSENSNATLETRMTCT